MNQKPQQRRGLGRGLGSLIPTAPASPPAADPADLSTAAGNGHVSDTSGSSGSSASAVAPGSTENTGTSGTAGSPDASGTSSPVLPTADGQGLAPVAGAHFAELPVTAISPNPRQPRQVFDEDAMAELVHSIKEIGLLQPVVVRAVGEAQGEPRYELIMGERRWRATQEAGLDVIPAIVRDTSDDDLLRDALLENLHRAQLNPLEEAAAYQQLLDDFGCTHEELAGRIGRSRPQISNTLRLLKLSPAVQRRVAAGVLSAGHARALLAVDNADIQDRLAGRVVAEGISVRGLEEIVTVGDLGSGVRPAVRRNKPTAPALADLAERLSDRLETRVKVDLGRSKGKITVEFASIPDLERIVAIMDPKPGSAPSTE
jgi:ParB family chromosome partitioning protein